MDTARPRPRNESQYSITQVVEISGLTAHTLRWYEQVGLIHEVERGQGGKRIYSAENLRWLEFLNRLRQTGMSVADMTAYVALARRGDHTMAARRRLLEEHLTSVLDRLRELTETVEFLNWKIEVYRTREAACSATADLISRDPSVRGPGPSSSR